MLDKEKYSVIIVDDDKDICDMFKRRLKGSYDVISFHTAQDLLNNIDQLTPSLFVLDWLFPEMDGIELSNKIREQHKFDLVPIVFYTAVEPTNENIEKAFEVGAETFISKTQSSYLLFLNVRTLVNSYFRKIEYLQQRQVMLSVLKHDMANHATCLTTGVQVLSMNKAFEKSGLEQQIKPILSASNKLRLLFEDLKEVLITDNRDYKETVKPVQMRDIFNELEKHLDGLSRTVEFAEPGIEEITCDFYRFCRCLYYMVMFIDKHVPSDLAVNIEVLSFDDNPVFLISVKGLFRKSFEDAMINEFLEHDIDSRHDFLFVNYIENVLAWHKTSMNIVDDDEKSGILFVLPQRESALVEM